VSKLHSDMARDFVGNLYPTIAGQLSLLVWDLETKHSHWFKSAVEAAKFAAGKKDVYIGCSLHDVSEVEALASKKKGTAVSPELTRGFNKTARAIGGLWIDIDFASEHHKSKRLPPDLPAAIGLAKAILYPTFILNTGNGLQAWWLFKEVWEFENDAEQLEASDLILKWQEAFRRIATKAGWEVDATHDLSRILRIPGTYNGKNKTPPLVEIIEVNKVRYNPSDFLEYLPSGPLTIVRKPTTELPEVFVEPNNAKLNQRKWKALREADPRIEVTFKRQRKDLTDSSASGYDMALASYTVQAGWSDQEICDLLVIHRMEHNDGLKRPDYFARTIARARATQNIVASQQRIEDMVDITAPKEDGEDNEKRKADLIEELSNVFGMQLNRVIKFMSDPPTYRLETELGSISLGQVNNLIEQIPFRQKVAAATNKLIARQKQKLWDKYAQALLDCCDCLDVGLESTEYGSIYLWLKEYFEENRPIDDKETAYDLRKPFTDSGHLCFFLTHFQNFLKVRGVEKRQPKDLTPLLRGFGADTKSIRCGKHADDRPKYGFCWIVENGKIND